MISFKEAFVIIVIYAIACYYVIFPKMETYLKDIYAGLQFIQASGVFVIFLTIMYFWFKNANTGRPRPRLK